MTTIADLAQSLQTVFTTTAERLARTTGFVQRTSKLTGAVFAQAVVFGWLADPHASLEALAQTAAAVGVSISAQGLDQRLGEAAATFLEEMLRATVHTVIAAEPVAIPLLARFSAVVLCDSSTITLPPALAPWWPGCSAGTAALKLHVRYDLVSGQLTGPLLSDGRTSDRRTAVQTAPLPRGALRLADLGYFTLDVFAQFSQAGVFWLSRLLSGTAVYTPDGGRQDVLALLQQSASVDRPILLGAHHRLPARLLAVRLPQEQVNQRRRRLRQRAREKGETPSATSLAWADWFIVVTTVPPGCLSLREALVLLRARWQVEELFKLWKDHGQVDTSVSSKPWRILCEVYAKLLALVVQHWLLLTGCWHLPDRSLTKAAQTIRAHALHLACTLACALRLTDTIGIIQRCIASGCRLSRRKQTPSSFQLLLDPALGGLG